MDKRQSFLRGAVVLSVAGALSKVLGAIYRIPLARLLEERAWDYTRWLIPFILPY